MSQLTVWIDDFALATLPGVEQGLLARGCTVLRTFARLPNPATVAQFSEGARVAVVGGRTFSELVERTERATTSLRIGVIAALPLSASECTLPAGPGLVDVLPHRAADADRRISLMANVPIVSGRIAVRPLLEPAPRLVVEVPFARPPVAIASSTGGSWLLAELVRGLDRRLLGPVLIAQHMEGEFVPFFLRWLQGSTGWPTVEVSHEAKLEDGTLYLATGGRDLCVGSDGLFAYSAPPSSRFVPNADRLFGTFAAAFGQRGTAVVLSGMGSDGAHGMAEVVRRGGRGLCQEPSSAIIPSMPESALSAARGALAVPPPLLASEVLRTTRT